MKLAIINGSPRKTGNTATLLKECINGAQTAGAECDLINLYSLNYKGCTSCFQCKRIGGKSYGVCAMTDDLTPFLTNFNQYDGIILGSPIYYGSETGEMRSFLERLMFPYLTYTPGYGTLFARSIPTAMIYTMNITEEQIDQYGYAPFIERAKATLSRTFGGPSETLCATDTCQFNDYSQYLCTVFDPAHKVKRKEEVFPEDCRKAAELGRRMAETISQ